MSATPIHDSTIDSFRDAIASSPRLYLAFELGWNQWKLGFATGLDAKPWRKTIEARDLTALRDAVARARRRFELSDDAPVCSCYEAGRDGFWLHRFLDQAGVDNCVVDSASIEVNRRAKRAKTDRMDVNKLLSMLIRHHQGEAKVWSIVRVPTEADEERRELHRELLELKHERTRCTNRIKGLLARCGLAVTVDKDLLTVLNELTTWDGRRFVEVYPQLHQRLGREFERMQVLNDQIRQLERQRLEQLRHGRGREVDMARQLLGLHGVGLNSAWLAVMECFGWRMFDNRRQVGALIGMAPTPYQSGDSHRDQGISKAGNPRLRIMAVELAWCWLRFQPDSELARWYERRFAHGSKRQRKIGIVALGRKLLIKLWQYLQTGQPPEGAIVVDWQIKVNGNARPIAA
jgi:transposase